MSEELEALIAYRLSEAQESREEAQLLFDSNKYRGAINRAYYSMFYAALALLASRQLVASKHSGVISVVHREFVKTGIMSTETAKFLDIAFDLRNKCDYRDFIDPTGEQVVELIEESGKFIEAVRNILSRQSPHDPD